jgi:hypothetical protein
MQLSCVWMTREAWAELDGVDVDFFDVAATEAGSTYVRTCEDGTVWFNATFTAAVRDA